MNEFDILVSNEYYKKLLSDNITDVVTLNNAKARKYKVGNHLTITNEETKESFEIEIAGFLYFNNIADAFAMVGKRYLGFSGKTSTTKIEDKFLESFKPQDVEKYGIVVISYNKK